MKLLIVGFNVVSKHRGIVRLRLAVRFADTGLNQGGSPRNISLRRRQLLFYHVLNEFINIFWKEVQASFF